MVRMRLKLTTFWACSTLQFKQRHGCQDRVFTPTNTQYRYTKQPISSTCFLHKMRCTCTFLHAIALPKNRTDVACFPHEFKPNSWICECRWCCRCGETNIGAYSVYPCENSPLFRHFAVQDSQFCARNHLKMNPKTDCPCKCAILWLLNIRPLRMFFDCWRKIISRVTK